MIYMLTDFDAEVNRNEERDSLRNTPIKYLVNLTKAMRLKEILTSNISKENQLWFIANENLFSNIADSHPWNDLEINLIYVEDEYKLSYTDILNRLEELNEDKELYEWQIGEDWKGNPIIKSKQEIINDLYAYALKTRSSEYWTDRVYY